MAEESAHHRHRVSVVIPTFCRPEHLADSLGALESQTVKPTDVVVIDGSPPSDDRSELLLKREADRLEFAVLYLRASGGAAVQRNIGIDHATEDYVFFVDDDVQPDPGCLEMLLSGLEQDESRDYAAMGGQSRSNKSPLRAWRWRIYWAPLGPGRSTDCRAMRFHVLRVRRRKGSWMSTSSGAAARSGDGRSSKAVCVSPTTSIPTSTTRTSICVFERERWV